MAIRPQNASPYKKSLTSSTGSTIAPISLSNTLTNRLQQSGPMIAHSSDEIQRLAPSTSTEELNQEMANLEGLMKGNTPFHRLSIIYDYIVYIQDHQILTYNVSFITDLSAITASEFEC